MHVDHAAGTTLRRIMTAGFEAMYNLKFNMNTITSSGYLSWLSAARAVANGASINEAYSAYCGYTAKANKNFIASYNAMKAASEKC